MLILRKQNILYLTLLFLSISSNAFSIELPPSPDGLEWYKSKNGVGTFLKPKNWHIKEEKSSSGTNALFITRENIKTNSQFIVGMGINQITSFSKKSKKLPSVYAKAYIKVAIEKHKIIKTTIIKTDAGDMNIARVVGDNNGVSTILHYIVIGIDKDDELYIITHEAPEKEWGSLYHLIHPMLNYILLGS